MSDTAATAFGARDFEPPPVPETGLTVLPDVMTPEAFEARIKLEGRMRKILTAYVKDNLKEGHHYYTKLGNQELEKPGLKKEGAYNIASLFKLIFGPPVQNERYFEDGHYQCDTTIDIFNGMGERIATGVGICTTRESKYRWRKESRTCPDCGAAAIFKDKKREGGWYCWTKRDGCGAQFKAGDPRIEEQQIGRVENTDLADSYNTVRKMSLKRAQTGGICQVPLVSEIFAPHEDDEDDDDRDHSPANTRTNRENQPRSNGSGQSSAPQPVQQQVNSIKTVVDLTKKLVENHGVEPTALVEQFLPEDIGRFEDLSEEQAAGIAPLLVSLINSKLEEKRSQR